MLSLGEIAKIIGAECHGDENIIVNSVADIDSASSGQLSFITNSQYVNSLSCTQASAIITSQSIVDDLDLDLSKQHFLLMDNPYLGYAKSAQLFDTTPKLAQGIHPSAIISKQAEVSPSACIAANVVIESGCKIADRVSIGAGCHIGENVSIGEGTRLYSSVNLYHDVSIGKRAILHSGCVIGSDGFGFANDGGEWIKIPQLGGVSIGDDFEAGANCVIDRGALKDTLIGDCVKLDNLVHIAHNVEVGDATAMAAMTGIAGGTSIGKGCTLAGRVGVIGHLTVCDNVHLTVNTLLTRSVSEPGVYSSGDIAQPNKQWKRKTARMRQLDDMFSRVRVLEKTIKDLQQDK